MRIKYWKCHYNNLEKIYKAKLPEVEYVEARYFTSQTKVHNPILLNVYKVNLDHAKQ